MEKTAIPYRKTVFVCTHVREDGRQACANPGRHGESLCTLLKEEVKERGLKEQIRVVRSGCFDLCAQGPNVFFQPDGIWFSGVSEEDVPTILKELADHSLTERRFLNSMTLQDFGKSEFVEGKGNLPHLASPYKVEESPLLCKEGTGEVERNGTLQ